MFSCVYIPDFPAEAIVRLEPELREQPLAVVEGKPPLLKVLAVNERGRQCGIEIGMTQVQAQGYVASIEMRKRAPGQEQAAHAALMDCACAMSPRVYGEAPDTVLLDMDGMDRLFGPPAKIARELARRVGELGMEANVGVASNVEAAIHAARGFAGITVIPRGKEAERLAALSVDVLFDAHEERSQEMLDALERWGVRTFRALALLPEIALSQRLGEAGVRLRKLARGEGSRPLVPTEAPLEFEETVELEEAIDLLEPLAFVLNRMLEQLCARLATRSLAAQELRLRMELDPQEDICIEHSACGIRKSENLLPPQRHRDTEGILEKANHGSSRMHTDAEPGTIRRGLTPDADLKSKIENQKSEIEDSHFELTLKFPVPMLDVKVFLKLLKLELRAKPPQAPVTKIWLRAEPARPRSTQGGLFLPEAPEPERLEVTLARIAGVVTQPSAVSTQHSAKTATTVANGGASSQSPENAWRVGSAEVLDSHRPDAFRMKRFAPVQHSASGIRKTNHGCSRIATDSKA